MSEMKTRPTGAAVTEFLNGVGDEGRRADAFEAMALMERVTGEPPRRPLDEARQSGGV